MAAACRGVTRISGWVNARTRQTGASVCASPALRSYNDIVIAVQEPRPEKGVPVVTMKCPICGKQTLPGAKLCGPCRAALKRAKDDSVWELPPSQRPGEVRAQGARTPSRWVLGAPRLRGWQAWTLGILVLGVCAGGAMLLARPGEPAPAQAAAAPLTRPTVVEPANAVERAIPASTQAPTAAVSVAPAIVAGAEGIVQPERHDHSQPPRSVKPPKPALEAPSVVTPPPEPSPPEPVRPAVPPPAPVARPVDPWQRMQDALNRCRGEDLFSRLGCEYRARSTYCDGHWGEVAQCPAQFNNDHGQ